MENGFDANKQLFRVSGISARFRFFVVVMGVIVSAAIENVRHEWRQYGRTDGRQVRTQATEFRISNSNSILIRRTGTFM
jgi:hypothetical protein